jgi:hypothetical protein
MQVVGLLALGVVGCKQGADFHGTVSQAGKGVPGASVSLSCPDGSKHLTSTNSTGDFRFEELGPGVDDACIVEVLATGTWIAPVAVGNRCAQHAASGLCSEALFAFNVR